ncbi:Receptor-like kinase [Melia azedarach]|uniref:Receptor-like kinase n=1 Tax=Melia azedarach TaxID=155640 RepID=A0ACC1YQP4_MELAZ|nr:Receptor-like kinase [Melia azedarach]
MKKTQSRLMLYSRQTKQKSDARHGKVSKHPSNTFSSLNYIIAAAKKVTRIFGFFLSRQRKSSSKDGVFDDTNNNSQVSKLSYSSDSNTRSSRLKSSNSYGSSGSKSGQATTINFSIEDIQRATGNFSPANKIGEGGCGTVYKGKLRDGSVVAVKRAKRMNKYDKYLLLEFKNEILTLSKIEHLNLVKLFGFLEHEDERIIVVEYIGNGNLREHLDGKQGNGLELAERLDIAIDVAHALAYLHTYSDTPVIHRDIKASNILITEKLRAKVSDFGFARMLVEDPAASHISTQVKGTAGYLDPDYLRTYQLTEKSDVYSFGVLLVEMMTGRYPIEPKKPMKERVTIRWAMQSLKAGEAILVMDARLRRSPASNMAVEKVLKLAHECLAPTRQPRPSMKKCAEILWGIRKDFREKAFSTTSSASTSHHSSHYPTRDAKKSRKISFGMEDGDSYRFVSA